MSETPTSNQIVPLIILKFIKGLKVESTNLDSILCATETTIGMTGSGLLLGCPVDLSMPIIISKYRCLPSFFISFLITITSVTSPILTLYIYFLSRRTSLSVVYTHPTESEYLYTYFITFYLFTLLQLLPTVL